MSLLVNVILSGIAPGVSSEEQFMPVYSGESLFHKCVERNVSFADRQLVVGRNEYYVQARDYFRSKGNKAYLNIIEEDQLTNVYSVAFAAFSAGAEEILLITPSNSIVNEDEAYTKAIDKMILIAGEGQIGVLSFHSEQAIHSMPFMVCEGERVKSFEEPTDKEEKELLAENKQRVIYSGILCCKAGVYLKELKALAPKVYEVTERAWEARVAQYVSIDLNIKVPQATIEQVLLTSSDKVKVVVAEATLKLHIPTNNRSINGGHMQPETKGNKQGPKIFGLAL